MRLELLDKVYQEPGPEPLEEKIKSRLEKRSVAGARAAKILSGSSA